MILRLRSHHIHAENEPDTVVQRVETELADAAYRYRLMLWVTLGTFLSPGLIAWTAWDMLWRKTSNGYYVLPPGQYEPFVRGFFVPNVSLYEMATYAAVFSLMGAALYLSYLTVVAMYRLAPDYQMLRESDVDYRTTVAKHAASGRWPRVHALLTRNKEFAHYTPLIEVERELLARSSSESDSTARADALSPAHWGVAVSLAAALATVAVILGASFAEAAIWRMELSPLVRTLAVGGTTLLAYTVILAVLWWFSRSREAGFWRSFGFRSSGIVDMFGVGVTLALAARCGTTLWGMLLRALGVRLSGSEIDPTRMLPPGVLGVTFTVLAAVVLAPLVEEMVFRGMMLDSMRQRWGDRAGVYASSVVFTAAHASPYALVPFFVLSVLLSRLYIRTRSLWAPVFAHAAFNAIGIAAIYWLRSMGVW